MNDKSGEGKKKIPTHTSCSRFFCFVLFGSYPKKRATLYRQTLNKKKRKEKNYVIEINIKREWGVGGAQQIPPKDFFFFSSLLELFTPGYHVDPIKTTTTRGHAIHSHCVYNPSLVNEFINKPLRKIVLSFQISRSSPLLGGCWRLDWTTVDLAPFLNRAGPSLNRRRKKKKKTSKTG